MFDQPADLGHGLVDGGRSDPVVSLSQLLLALDDPLILLDRSADITMMNSAAESLLGRRSADVAGIPVRSLLTEGSGRPDRALAKAVEACLAGDASQAMAVFSSPHGEDGMRCSLLPILDEKGSVDGVLLFLRALRGGQRSSRSSAQALVSAQADTIGREDFFVKMQEALPTLVESLDLDFMAFRLLGPGGRPMLICYGIDHSEARQVLEGSTKDGTPMYQAVSFGESFVVDDPTDPMCDLAEGISSLACFPFTWSTDSYGCAAFGTRRPGISVRNYRSLLKVFCDQMSLSLRYNALHDEMRGLITQLRGLYETSKAVSTNLDLDDVLQTIMRTAMGLVDAENCFIFELDEARGKLSILSMLSSWTIDPTLELSLDEGIVGYVARTGKGVLSERADIDPRARPLEGTPNAPSTMITVPLIFSDKTLGVMSLERTPGLPFGRADYDLIEMFSIQAAMAINNASMFRDLGRTASSLRMYNVLLTHDVANFNSPIHGFLEMLLRDPKLDERQWRFVRSALVQSDNISELISDVREMFLLRSEKERKPLETVDMISVIKEAMNDIFSNAVYEDIETNLDSTTERAEVMADAFLKRLFYNIMANACKYGKGAPIDISVSERHMDGRDWWNVRVIDRGIGIMDEQKAQMFKRFDQMDTANAANGHGLGLSVVGALTERYGGRIWVEDRIPGDHSKGSIFQLLLPRVAPAAYPEA